MSSSGHGDGRRLKQRFRLEDMEQSTDVSPPPRDGEADGDTCHARAVLAHLASSIIDGRRE